jgi:hypothetical protein
MGRRSLALSFALLALVLTAVVKAAAPTGSLSQNQGTANGGNDIQIFGTGLTGPGFGVTFGGVAAQVLGSAPDGSFAAVRTPAHAAGVVDVVLTNADGSTTLTNAFTYVAPDGPAPTISSYTPTSGTTIGGTEITLTGTNYRANATVTVGGTPATNVVVVNATTITARTPPAPGGGAFTAQVRVTNSDFTTGAAGTLFGYSPFCNGGTITDNCITSLLVNGAPAPAGVTALFQGQGGSGGGFQVSIINNNNMPDRFELSPDVAPTDTITVIAEISAYDPVGALSTGDIQDQGFRWDGANNEATLILKPRASSWSQSPGCQFPPGTCAPRASVDYTSFALALIRSGNGTPPALLPHIQGMYMSTNAQTFSTPDYDPDTGAFSFMVGAPSKKFADTNAADDNADGDPEPDGDPNDQGFFNFFISNAFITNVWGIPDPNVLVTDPTQLQVTIGALTITPTIVHVNSTATSPAGKKISFSPFGYSTHTIAITVAPTVTSVSPSNVLAGATSSITINGLNFRPGATVTIGGTAATNVTVVSGTTITATAPALPAGAKNVVVTNEDGTLDTLVGGLTYSECAFNLSATHAFYTAAGGAGSVNVTTFSSCPWGMTNPLSWVTVDGTFPRTGNGTVTFTVAPNTTGAARSGTVFIAGRPFLVRQAPEGVAAGDLNGDNALDLLLWNEATGHVAAWLMNGPALVEGRLLEPGRVADRNWRPVGMGDFDGDGDNDVLWQHTNRTVAVWLMNGTVMQDVQLLSPAQLPPGWTVRAVTDLNADGKPDLVVQRVTDGAIAAWLMNGLVLEDGMLLSPAAVGDIGWHVVGAGDFNGDGHVDLAWQHNDGFLAVWYMNGTVRLDVEFFSPNRFLDPGWRVKGVGDMNRDGKPDLLLQHTPTGNMGVWFMNGATLIDGRLLAPARPPADGWLLVGPR